MDKKYRDAITTEFKSCIDRTIQRLKNEETYRPFHTALLSKDALFWSRFERSFSTSFGQRVIEKVSKIAAQAGGAQNSENQKATLVKLSNKQLAAIENHVSMLRGGRFGRAPNWNVDIEEVRVASNGGGNIEEARVISDLWWLKDGINHYLSIKTVKPNIDQTAEAKRDLLKLQLHDPNSKVFYGLYYNPYGENRQDYNWTPPMGIFNFRNDPVILIGRDYWETLGGIGFYDELIEIAEEIGEKTRVNLGELKY